MKKKTFAVVAIAILAFAGCLPKNGGTTTPRAGILIDLLSPNATNTGISLNGNIIGTNVSYGSIPQYYNQVTAGMANVSVYNSASQPLLNYNFTTEPGNFYSVFLVDSVEKMKGIVVADTVDYPATTDSVKVRFYNFAPGSPTLSVGIKDSSTIWNLRSFETQTTANERNSFLDFKAGSYTFQIFTPYSATSVKDTTITFEGKHIYTLFLKGFYTDTTGGTRLGLGVVRHG